MVRFKVISPETPQTRTSGASYMAGGNLGKEKRMFKSYNKFLVPDFRILGNLFRSHCHVIFGYDAIWG